MPAYGIRSPITNDRKGEGLRHAHENLSCRNPRSATLAYAASCFEASERSLIAAAFCIEADEEALAKHGKPDIFNSDSQKIMTSS